MNKLTFAILAILLLAIPVSAVDFTAPEAPESVQELLPNEPESFGEGLWMIAKAAIARLQPDFAEGGRVCISLIAVVLLVSLLLTLHGETKQIVELVGTLTIGALLLKPSNSLVCLGAQTVEELSEYGKLLLPVMTGAMAAQGGVTASAALYAGTAMFDALLGAMISKLIVPMMYIYLCLSIANSAIGEEILMKLRDFVKWLMTWSLKTVLYIFTGYMGVTGVVSGSADAAAVKAAKLTISGVVPVVGGILSDASEAVLIGAGVMKNAAGMYGLLAILAVWIGPFLKIGVQYLLLKLTSAVCGVFGSKSAAELIQNFCSAMGLLLGMTGAVCLMLLVSTVCFMKGVA